MDAYFAFLFICTFLSGLSSELMSECNPLACFYHFNKFFVYEKGRSTCTKFKKFEDCIASCSVLMTDEDFSARLKRLELKICNHVKERFSNDILESKCLQRRKFQLLSCAYQMWNLESSNNDTNLLACRKISESENCPTSILFNCDDNIRSYVEDLFIQYFEHLQKRTCRGYSQGDVWNLNVTSQFAAYNQLSKCFDHHHEEILSCVPAKWTANFILNRYAKFELCNAFQAFLHCVGNSIVKNCGSEFLDTFNIIADDAQHAFLPYCARNDILKLGSGDTHPKDVHTDKMPEASDLSDIHGRKDISVHENVTYLTSEVVIIHYWKFSDNAAVSMQLINFLLFISVVFALIF